MLTTILSRDFHQKKRRILFEKSEIFIFSEAGRKKAGRQPRKTFHSVRYRFFPLSLPKLLTNENSEMAKQETMSGIFKIRMRAKGSRKSEDFVLFFCCCYVFSFYPIYYVMMLQQLWQDTWKDTPRYKYLTTFIELFSQEITCSFVYLACLRVWQLSIMVLFILFVWLKDFNLIFWLTGEF